MPFVWPLAEQPGKARTRGEAPMANSRRGYAFTSGGEAEEFVARDLRRSRRVVRLRRKPKSG